VRYSKCMVQSQATRISFSATPEYINDTLIVRLPADVSATLPSRGQVAMQGTLNGRLFAVVLEPDGEWGHWFKLNSKTFDPKERPIITAVLDIATAWPEPVLPSDFKTALQTAPPEVVTLWPKITPMARWEWVRWINATNNADTRRRRLEVSISKMLAGKRRPCCFNLSACTDPAVSKNGRLLSTKN